MTSDPAGPVPTPPRTSPLNLANLAARVNAARARLKQSFAELTDDDLAYVKGREDELLARLQQRTGLSREELERELVAEGE